MVINNLRCVENISYIDSEVKTLRLAMSIEGLPLMGRFGTYVRELREMLYGDPPVCLKMGLFD